MYTSRLDTAYDIVGDIDEPNMSYEFNILRVYRRKADGKYFYATDAGCSCPCPFEDTTEADLIPYSAHAIREWARDHGADASSILSECGE